MAEAAHVSRRSEVSTTSAGMEPEPATLGATTAVTLRARPDSAEAYREWPQVRPPNGIQNPFKRAGRIGPLPLMLLVRSRHDELDLSEEVWEPGILGLVDERLTGATQLGPDRQARRLERLVLPAGVSPVGWSRPDLNPRQRLERPLSLTTRLRERHGPVAGRLFEPFREASEQDRERSRPM